mgnify:CR=1 FL=1
MKIWNEMAKDFAEQLNRIGHKAELLVTRFNTLKEQNAVLRDEVLELRAQLVARDSLIEKQQIELEHLRVSSALAPDVATAREARASISELVREIDVCIADLMKEV